MASLFSRAARRSAKAAALLAMILIAPVEPAPAAPARFPDGRFVVDRALLRGDGRTRDVVEIRAHRVAIASGCPWVKARVRQRRGVFHLRARWSGCAGLRGPVRLHARLDPRHELLEGTLAARPARHRVEFVATRLPGFNSTCLLDGTASPTLTATGC
jgi:hypothetical protein